MWQETYDLYIKDKEKAKEKEKAKDKERGEDKERDKGKEKGKGKEKVKRETVEETKARLSDLQEQRLRGEIHDVAEFARLAKGKGKGRSGGRAAPEKGKGKGTSKGKSKEAHELNSCDTGTLRYRADVPLNARRGARVDTSPHTTGPQRVYEPGGRSWTDTDTDMSVRTDLD